VVVNRVVIPEVSSLNSVGIWHAKLVLKRFVVFDEGSHSLAECLCVVFARQRLDPLPGEIRLVAPVGDRTPVTALCNPKPSLTSLNRVTYPSI